MGLRDERMLGEAELHTDIAAGSGKKFRSQAETGGLLSLLPN